MLARIVTAGPVVLSMVALLGAGCLESAPAPPKGYVDDAGSVPRDAAAPDLADGPPGFRDGGDGGTEDWAGIWQFVSGSMAVTCGGSFSVQGVEGYLSIKADGADGLTVEEDGCTFHFAVAGDVATQTPAGQTCAKWAIPMIPEWTLTMQADGTLEERLGGGVSVGGESCTIGGRATLRRQ